MGEPCSELAELRRELRVGSQRGGKGLVGSCEGRVRMLRRVGEGLE